MKRRYTAGILYLEAVSISNPEIPIPPSPSKASTCFPGLPIWAPMAIPTEWPTPPSCARVQDLAGEFGFDLVGGKTGHGIGVQNDGGAVIEEIHDLLGQEIRIDGSGLTNPFDHLDPLFPGRLFGRGYQFKPFDPLGRLP